MDANNRCEARKYACTQFTVDFGSVSHGLGRWVEWQSKAEQNQSAFGRRLMRSENGSRVSKKQIGLKDGGLPGVFRFEDALFIFTFLL